MREALLSHPGKVEHVKEVHAAQDEHDNAEFRRYVFDAFNNAARLGTDTKKEKNKTDVDEVKADYKKVIYRIGHFLIPREGFDEKKSAVFMQRLRYPNRHPKTDEEIRGVDKEANVHGLYV